MVPPRYRSAAAALVLLAVNAYITLRLFHVAYTRQMGSIEAAFISLARYIRDHFPHLTWYPLWYEGIPFADAYPPLLHFITAGVAAAGGASPGLAYHIVTATLYALGPVALFWMARRLGATRSGAFLGALGYSLLSPACWLVREVRYDSGGWFGPRRLVAMVKYGEGPHIASLLFLVLAIGLLHLALERRRAHHFFLAALAMAAVVLSNWIGAVELGLATAAYLLAGFHKGWKPAWLRSLAVGVYAYAIAMPWVTPSTVATIRASAPRLVGFKTSSWLFWIFAASLLLLAWVLKRRGLPPALRFALLLLYGPTVLALASFWFHVDLVPQANRYHLLMDLAVWLGVAFLASRLRSLTLAKARVAAAPMYAAAAVLVLLPGALMFHQHRLARELEAPIDIESTAEYKISHWFGTHMPGRRVFAPGSVSFWMDAFSDTPMLVGGFDNGIRNLTLWDVNFQILFGDKLPIALAWLKAFGCDAIVGDDFTSREVFHPYAHPGRLHGLPELWRDGPDVIYAVPRRGSLAHAIPPTALVRQIPHPYETKAIDRYVAALDDASLPAATFTWRDPATAVIRADLNPEYLLSVQVTWDPGWRATVNGERRPVWGDKLGQIVVEPQCSGACTVDLIYDGGFELQFARWASALALVAGAVWILWQKLSGSAKTN
ncbi:MAG TPA: hypothetical protein VLW65_08170 [Bryobacteraceae bacterium]|nr:hypothetical protein [Bryobacteraceae bacterium]